MSPHNGSSSLTSPPTSRLASASILQSIAEDENVEPRFTLSQRREGAPSAIEIPIIDTVAGSLNLKPRTNSVVSFADDNLKVEEIPCHSPWSAASPIPSEYKVHAGHTPVKTPARPLTPSLHIEDTPTKSNTQINASLAKSDDEDEDPALKGPLSMPELPNQPGEHNFTEEALFKRLEHIAQSPGTEEARPLVFATRTPGLATPEAVDGSPKAINRYDLPVNMSIDSIPNSRLQQFRWHRRASAYSRVAHTTWKYHVTTIRTRPVANRFERGDRGCCSEELRRGRHQAQEEG
jgi:hypothetical protein